MAYSTTIKLTSASGSSWSVPADWNQSDNAIYVFGAGAQNVGGGGACVFKINHTLSSLVSVSFSISGSHGVSPADTIFDSSAFIAKSGSSATGGQAAASTVPASGTKANGGNASASAGGGAGGPHGAGANASGTTGGNADAGSDAGGLGGTNGNPGGTGSQFAVTAGGTAGPGGGGGKDGAGGLLGGGGGSGQFGALGGIIIQYNPASTSVVPFLRPHNPNTMRHLRR